MGVIAGSWCRDSVQCARYVTNPQRIVSKADRTSRDARLAGRRDHYHQAPHEQCWRRSHHRPTTTEG